jgi:hypothetical protein
MDRRRCRHCQARVSSNSVWCSNCGERAHAVITRPLIATGCTILLLIVAWIVWALWT